MKREIGQIALLVRDYDEAIAWYRRCLDFEVLEDTPQNDTKRWVRMAPAGAGFSLLLARAVTQEQRSRVGNQTGGRVFLFLYTDDFGRDYEHMKAAGVSFIGEPRDESYGNVVVFEDLYGNKWDFIQAGAEN